MQFLKRSVLGIISLLSSCAPFGLLYLENSYVQRQQREKGKRVEEDEG